MQSDIYTAKDGYVWKEPVERKCENGTSTFTLRFRVCKMTPEVGDEAAATVAALMTAGQLALETQAMRNAAAAAPQPTADAVPA